MKATALTALAFATQLVSSTANAQSELTPRHIWQMIAYPPIDAPWGQDRRAHVSLFPKAEGLHVHVTIFDSADDERAKLPTKGELRARLHRDRGPTEFVDVDTDGCTTGRCEHYQHVFPWGVNGLAEAWLELRVRDAVYWLEVPYGFDRDPGRSIEGVTGKDGAPVLAAAMNALPSGAKIVPWGHVRYEVGTIQNDWHLTVIQTNPFDATTELVLYRDDSRVGASLYLWDLHEPRTSVSIVTEQGRTVGSHCVGLRLHSDGMRRSDTFDVSRNSSQVRGWGTMKIRVGDREHELVLPSSMFRYAHGAAAPHHPARRER